MAVAFAQVSTPTLCGLVNGGDPNRRIKGVVLYDAEGTRPLSDAAESEARKKGGTTKNGRRPRSFPDFGSSTARTMPPPHDTPPMVVHRTCRWAGEIELTATHCLWNGSAQGGAVLTADLADQAEGAMLANQSEWTIPIATTVASQELLLPVTKASALDAQGGR